MIDDPVNESLTEVVMLLSDQQSLRDKTTALVIDWAKDRQPPFTGENLDGFDDAITAAHIVADESRLSLHRWIDAARRTGMSWADIGEVLGISKQAAQQRFRSLGQGEDPDIHDGEEIVRIGATAFNEMRMLHDEGLKGNELVRTGALMLVFRRSDRLWEYRRRIGSSSLLNEMRKAGWTHVSSWLPFHYFKRPMSSAE
jgi:hypothetical protein